MDERMQAGRHHLTNGERALQQGYPEDGRSHFEAALVQFRGPDLRLGEAHALRGLAQVELAAGDLVQAEQRTRGGIEAYQAVHADLDRLDQRGVSHELRRDAKEGEGAALVLLGEILMRTGRVDEARTTLSIAREVASGLGELPSAAAAWAASAKLSLHEGRYPEAKDQLDKMLAMHTRSGNAGGETEAWLLIAELNRLQRDSAGAMDALNKARDLAERTNSALHRGQVLAALAAMRLQNNQVEEARQTFAESLPYARESGDHELIASILVGLGDATSRLHEGFGLEHLLEGARVLAGRDQRHGLATALLRIGEHGLRIRQPMFALAAAEGARVMYRGTDPVRGTGYALRVAVKSLTAMKNFEAVFVSAVARESIAGHIQPNARDVATHWRARVPADWVEGIKPLGPKKILDAARSMIGTILTPALNAQGLSVDDLQDPIACLSAIEALAKTLPRPEPPEHWDRRVNAAPDEETTGIGPGSLTPPLVPTATGEVDFSGDDGAADLPQFSEIADEPKDLPTDAIEQVTEYETDYDAPPPTQVIEGEPSVSADPAVSDPANDAPVPEALRKAALPAEYADLYDPPDQP